MGIIVAVIVTLLITMINLNVDHARRQILREKAACFERTMSQECWK